MSEWIAILKLGFLSLWDALDMQAPVRLTGEEHAPIRPLPGSSGDDTMMLDSDDSGQHISLRLRGYADVSGHKPQVL